MATDRIPKIIHRCWFGPEPSEKIKNHRLQQEQALAGYRFMDWTEANVDLDEFPFLRHAFDSGHYAHLSDMVRLLVLKKHGGIYLDCDVEVVRPFDDLLGATFFIGYVWDCLLGTAVMGSQSNHPFLNDLLEEYTGDLAQFEFHYANNDFFTSYFVSKVPEFRLNGKSSSFGGVRILDKCSFEHPSFLRRQNYTIHHFAASWRGEARAKVIAKEAIIKLVSLYAYRKYVCFNSFRKCEFRWTYYEATRNDRKLSKA